MAQAESVTLTQELVRFPTINPPGRERACAHYVGGLLESAGFRLAYHEFDDERTSLIATLAGRGEKLPLCFTGHLDTVPLGVAPWTHDAHAGEIEGAKLWGRGSSDMKSGVAAFLTAARALGGRREPAAGMTLVITAGEETGCTGAEDLAARAGVLGRAGALVVAEPTSNYPCVGQGGTASGGGHPGRHRSWGHARAR